MADSGVVGVAEDGQESHSMLASADGVAADGQEPHRVHPGAVSVAEEVQEAHGGLLGAVCVAADGHEIWWTPVCSPHGNRGPQTPLRTTKCSRRIKESLGRHPCAVGVAQDD